MSKEEVLKTIATKFFVWFLTLSILTIGMTLILIGEHDHMLSERIIGGVALTPLALPLRMIFKNKAEKQEQTYKLAKIRLKIKKKQIRLDYKLKRLAIKYSF